MIFKVKRPDGLPEWQVVYDLVKGMPPGDIVSYDTLLAALETNDKHVVYSAVARANKHLWVNDNRSLRVVPKTGYRMLEPLEHEKQSNQFRLQGKRKIKNALAVMKATDLTALTNEQQNWVTKLVTGLSLMAAAVDAHAAKLSEHDSLIKSLSRRVEKIEEGRSKK